MPTLAQLQQWSSDRNVRALLDTIANAEGANYNTYYGGGTFNYNGPHPCRTVTAGRYSSTAAGRYQFLCATWRGLINRFGFTTMQPQNQDTAAIALIADNGGINAIINGDFHTAITRIRSIWPSLPGGSQQRRTWNQAETAYARAGGTNIAASTPTVASVVPVQVNDNGTIVETVSTDYLGEAPLVTPGMLAIGAAALAAYFLLR